MKTKKSEKKKTFFLLQRTGLVEAGRRGGGRLARRRKGAVAEQRRRGVARHGRRRGAVAAAGRHPRREQRVR